MTNQPAPAHAVIVFAHGSRDPAWRAPVEAVADRMRQLDPALLVGCAYLEMCAPDLPDAAAQLIAAGARDVTVLPLFIGVGKHAREDLPALLQRLIHTHPEVRFVLRPAVGEEPALIEAIARLALQ